jgi:Putative esterase
MTSNLVGYAKPKILWSLRLLVIFSLLLVPLVAFSHNASAAVVASDNFNRADGGLGTNWTAISDGGMAIASQQVVGTVGNTTGDMWTASSFTSDQYSQIQVTSTPLTGGQWVGAAVRMQSNGQNGYVGFYYWNNGSPLLELFKRSGGGWAQIAGTYSVSPLAAGTQLQVTAVGSAISVLLNGTKVISATDSSFTGGAPGMMAYGNGTADNWSGGNAGSYTVGGTVSGLSGTVVLQDNGGDNLSVTANGSFTFATSLVSGAAYSVTVKTNPSGQTCTVSSGSGTVGSANVTSVAVACAASATSAADNFNRADGGLGANWTAISDGGMAIASQQVTGTAGKTTGDTWTAGSFTSDQYSQVQVTSTPMSGTQWIGAAVRVQNGGLSAYAGLYKWNSGSPLLVIFKRTGSSSWVQLSGTYSTGVLAAGTQLQLTAVGSTISFWQNGVKRLSVTDTSFTGGAPGMMAYGNGTADNWSGGNAASSTVSGTVSGLSGTVVLQDNGVDDLSVSANGTFTFATALPTGAPYNVTVKTNPAGQTCTASSASGTMGSANVTSVAVTCSNAASYTVGGTVSGLSGTVVLQDNGGDNLSVSANGTFTFATSLVSGAAYSVTVTTNPSGQLCTVSNGSGTMGSANVTNVAVTCNNAASYTVGGTVSGLSGMVVLQDNGGDNLSVSANGTFTFATSVVSGAAYSVTVKTNPSGQVCTVSNGSGTVGSGNVTNVAVTCGTNTGTSASDNFNRADGGLGANWTAISDGGMTIASQQVVGTAAQVTGDTWTANTFGSDQYSEVQVTSTSMSGIQWVGPAVRVQNGGQDGYVGIYSWNSGSPVLELFERSGGSWTQLGAYNSGPLAAGTKLRLVALGNSISFMVNGVQRIGISDSSLSTGAPGIMAFDSATADNWSAGTPGFQVSYQSTDGNGVKSYDVLSTNDGYGPQTLRVLSPTNPAAGVAHNFLIVLPVQSGLQTTFGDGLTTLEGIDAQDQYNLTIIEPTFAIDPWYADNPNDSHLQYETFMTQELVPWIKQNLATTGQEQVWLLGFSKSGIGGQDLILKHPDLFTLAATWDLPADMSSYDQFGADSAQNYGTDANFQANYRLTTAFVDAHKTPFLSNNRIWVGGYNLYQPDDTDYNALLTSEGIVHSSLMQSYPAHSWDSGWVPAAMAALYQDSINLH